MERVGVAAVVEGLGEFLGDMGKMDNSIRSLISPTNILGSVFGGLGKIFSSVGSFVVNTLAHALGELLADAVQWVTSQIKELISATIEAGGEFQKLELRLNTLNFNDLTDSEKELANAQEIAIGQTKEQLSWLQKLAAQTPYDNTDISNVYTLARGYSFTDKEARGLTETIIDFTSGMGLGNTEIVRIIKNFGQMRQLGKLTQRDLNDLATGAFVPVNEVLARMRLETGLAGDEFDDFRKTGEGVDSFMRNFTKLVEEDFGGSAQKMARTFGAATDNVKDFIKSVVGLNIVKPILDVLGGRIAGFMDELTSEDRWNAIVGLANRIGGTLTSIVNEIITNLAPSVSEMADGVVGAFEKIADWLDAHREDIVEFIRVAVVWVQDELVPAIGQVWDFLFGSDAQPGAIQKFGDWLKNDFLPFIKTQVIPGLIDMFDLITGKGVQRTEESHDERLANNTQEDNPLQKVVGAVASLATALPAVLDLLAAIGQVIVAAFGSTEPQTFAEFVTNILVPAIQEVTIFINENREAFALLLKAIIALEVLGFVVGLFFSLVAIIASVVIGVGLLVAAFINLLTIGPIMAIIFVLWRTLLAVVTMTVTGIMIWIGNLIERFLNFKANVIQTFNEVMNAIKNKDWAGAGKAMVDGVIRGFKNSWGSFISLVRQLATNALSTFQSIFQINSPSKAMADIGSNIVKGLAKGVEGSAGMAIKAMSNTASAVMAAATPQMAYSPAITSPSQNTYSNTNNFSLNVNSSARTEPLISDFSMLQSLVGG